MKHLKLFVVSAFVAATVASQASPFEIVVTESLMGSNPNSSQWQGIQRYGFTGTGSAATTLAGISASQVSDPVGLYFNGTELFVGNRHGNSAASSVSRFTFDFGTDSFTSNGTITGNGLFGTHGLGIRPGTNDLYASNVNNGISIFTIGPSSATANGTIFSGSMRDAMFSSDGNNLYATTGISGTLKRHDFVSNMDTDYSISGASGLHFGGWRSGHMFVSDFGSGKVYDVTFDGAGAVTGSSVAVSLAGAIGVAFSPDEQEMFVSSHTGNLINRYLFNSNTSAWDFESTIATGSNMGDIQVLAVPEPASFAILGIGVVALVRRRRSCAN